MRPVSQRWAEGLASSHILSVEALLLRPNTDPEVIPLMGGSVTLAAGAATRGSCDLAFVDDGTMGLVPKDPSSKLAPYGNEIQISRGLVYPDYIMEMVSLGIYRIETVGTNDTSEGVEISVTGLDRSARIIDAKFEKPYEIVAGTQLIEAIMDVITEVYAAVQTRFADIDAALPKIVAAEGDDRWQFLQDIVSALGLELYFDAEGYLVLRPIPAVGSTEPVAGIVEGRWGVDVSDPEDYPATLLNAGREWGRDEARNKWIYTGENTDNDTPVRGEAVDDNPNSPTYYFSNFGRKPDFQSSSFISTVDQAEQAAEGSKARNLGISQQVNFGALVNPALEVNDVVRIRRKRTDINEDHILDSITIPCGPEDPMSGQTRTVITNG